MSAVEFGLTSQTPFVYAVSQRPFEQLLTESEALEARFGALSHLSRSIASSIASMTPEVLSHNLVALLRPLCPCDLANIVIFNKGNDDVLWRSLGAGQLARLDIPIEETTLRSVYQEQKPLWIVDSQQDERLAVRKEAQSAVGVGYRSLCRLPLRTAQGCFGVLSIASSRPHSYSEQEVRLLLLAADQVALGLANFLLDEELRKLKEQFREEKACVEDELCSEPSFEEIVGRSAALQRVFSGLLESELFGHEKGAFTGAIMRKPGRFEVADKGTLFLDEVGDIPLEVQSKLLRVLQEHEFERLGSTRTQQVDVRVIAATHRDLKQMVEEGTFRSDLYYRLHVFPLVVPPLRDRREDIPLIVRHFVEKYARRMNRSIETIPARTMEVFANYSWPGNVRELQNFIERAVILSPGATLRAPLDELKQETTQGCNTNLSTLEEMEREHVLRALREAKWVTGGPNGAAARLGMKRTTLAYRIRKLGIPVRPQ